MNEVKIDPYIELVEAELKPTDLTVEEKDHISGLFTDVLSESVCKLETVYNPELVITPRIWKVVILTRPARTRKAIRRMKRKYYR